jgi:endonuclease YncB( thermonuclease family)
MKTLASILVATVLLSSPAFADAPHMRMCNGSKNTPTKTCLVDGDTLWLNGENIRLKDFDTPEPVSKICGGAREVALAHRASARMLEILNGNAWTIKRFGHERGGRGKRTLATIYVNGRDVGDILISERLARKWPNGDEWWCKFP